MAYINRQTQLENRPIDPFSPIKRISTEQIGIRNLSALGSLNDSLLDGVEITPKSKVSSWLEENHVHHARILSDEVSSTRFLLGTQVIAGRDDIKKLSHVLFIENNRLIRVTLNLTNEVERIVVHQGNVLRAHLTINKFTGFPHVIYAARDDSGKASLFLDGKIIETLSNDIDFPFMAFNQAKIGQVQKTQPEYGIITYKCRDTGKKYIRHISQDSIIGDEIEFNSPLSLGGVDFAISGDNVLFRIDAIENDSLVTKVARSSDKGITLSEFHNANLFGFTPDEHLPSISPVFIDYLGNFHIPVATVKDNKRHLFDVMEDTAVEAMVLSTNGLGYALARFPKNPDTTRSPLGRGDGQTDGVGIIATALDKGQLLVSNSQSGGILYPQERLLNYEMPKAFAFKATECCYTRALIPNTVSMDYVFIECDDNGFPISNDLLIETWDMPLPTPLVEAKADGSSILLKIHRDAWFEIGHSIFNFDDPSIKINSVDFIDNRNVKLETSSTDLVGKNITFETKNTFYWHEGKATIY